ANIQQWRGELGEQNQSLNRAPCLNACFPLLWLVEELIASIVRPTGASERTLQYSAFAESNRQAQAHAGRRRAAKHG
ncbi:MAG: hypothetical protein WCA56_21490, partial [Xanthobacteraceae bacterium]